MKTSAIQTQLGGVILEEEMELTLADVCHACRTTADSILELVDEGILSPLGDTPQHWVFTGVQLRRARTALRLQTDLGVNCPGAALAVQLLEEIEGLRARLRLIEG